LLGMITTIIVLLIYAAVVSAVTWALMWPYVSKFNEAHETNSKVAWVRMVIAFWFILITVTLVIHNLADLVNVSLSFEG